MADINYTCPICGKQRKVSEFADPAKIRCRQCNGNMQPEKLTDPTESQGESTTDQNTAKENTSIPENQPCPATKKNKLKLAREKQPVLPPDESPGVVKSKKNLPEETAAPPLELHPKTKRKKPLVSQSFLTFVLFLLIGGISGFVRYGLPIETTQFAPLIDYAWVAVLFFHFSIVLKALTQDVMQGIFCLFIPGWSFIYLAISDHMYHKAVIFGLLIGVGYDGGLQVVELVNTGLSNIQEFIDTGGGDLRRR